jgi:hypothetical protein
MRLSLTLPSIILRNIFSLLFSSLPQQPPVSPADISSAFSQAVSVAAQAKSHHLVAMVVSEKEEVVEV